MTDSESETGDHRSPGGKLGTIALGLAYVSVGVGLVYSLATDSVESLMVVLVGIVALVAISLAVLVRREGLLTAENKLIGVFVLAAMGLLFGLSAYTDLSSEIVFGAVTLVGVVVPHLLLEYTDRGTSD
ncbi:hypothetical protein [Halorussus litoreus]|uniref:hypothetical protein n=1 Tax=Halorussus litoreus TaxID=1710536 RepID=UPI000E22523C|nr:hypothetical protein [Halorussus litoreus]